MSAASALRRVLSVLRGGAVLLPAPFAPWQPEHCATNSASPWLRSPRMGTVRAYGGGVALDGWPGAGHAAGDVAATKPAMRIAATPVRFSRIGRRYLSTATLCARAEISALKMALTFSGFRSIEALLYMLAGIAIS